MQEEQYWQAVLDRDATANDTFVYAVRSTGVYCRPSCPSRRPRRAQVVFYPLPEIAEQAGFRPCKRCHPRSEEDDAPQNPQAELVHQICRYIDQHLEDSLSLATLSAQAHVSQFHLQRIFKRVMGISPRQYVEARRLDQLKTHLKEGESVTQTLYESGYSSSSRLYERTPTQLGMTPTTYRRGGQGMHIAYTIVDCFLGRLLVAMTEKGICSINLAERDADLEAALRAEYPAAEITRDGASFQAWISALISHLNGQLPHLELPLDIQATAFQWRVWEELQTIPYGETRSYSEIAAAIGQPTARRAVAQACAANPVPLVIPCHRVVRSDGSLGGYRLGTRRKQRLLEQESRQAGKEAAIHP